MKTMRTYYRKKYPYYGKYKCKAELNWNETTNTFTSYELREYLSTLLNSKDYMIYGYYSIYVKKEQHLDIIVNDVRLREMILFAYKPAPGYEKLKGKEPKREKTLWYDKFSYKITIHVNRPDRYDVAESYKIATWCDENLQNAYQKSGTWGNVNFFFTNKHDATVYLEGEEQ